VQAPPSMHSRLENFCSILVSLFLRKFEKVLRDFFFTKSSLFEESRQLI
jgi:hypothetical protein